MKFRLHIAAALLLTSCGRQDTTESPTSTLSPPPTRAEANAPSAEAEPLAARVGPCLMQGNDRLQLTAVHAVGTEPFWGARIEGRCVTYSQPEDPDGTRVWTRYTKGSDGETWSGALGGQPFTLRIRAEAECSDGMSDKRYPLAVELLVRGEARRGCAEPVAASS